MPSEARNSKSIVFGDEYSRIFDEDNVTASKLLVPYLLFKPLEPIKKSIQARKRRRESVPDNEAFISLATFHILYAMKLLAIFESVDLSDGSNVDNVRNKAINLVWEVVAGEMPKRGELYTHDRFFKEKSTNTLIHDHILKTCKKRT